jgi:ABC-2 type transport system permease protein
VTAVERFAVADASGSLHGFPVALTSFVGRSRVVDEIAGRLGDISHFTPLGAAVRALQDSMLGHFPPAAPLLVMVAYALGFAYLAKSFFRWE